jgi:6-phosphogluconolactonase
MPESGVIKQEIVRVPGAGSLADEAAQFFVRVVTEAVNARGVCHVALSGGSTPKAMYARLCSEDLVNSVQWDKVHFYVSDERCVVSSSEDSNYGNADRLMLSVVKVAPGNCHPIQGPDKDPAVAARNYEDLIKETVTQTRAEIPVFDLIFLGMGPDGHTASLFPGTKALQETQRLVVENFVPKVSANRITFTYKLINQAAVVAFVVGGADKAGVVKEILQGNEKKYPSALVAPEFGRLVWILDAAASSQLT